MPVNMFDGITAENITSYWETLQQNEAPYLGEVLFPNEKQATTHVEWLRGATSAPKPLAPSALDAKAINRARQGFGKVATETRFFKESKYIDEALRQQLALAENSPIASQKDIILNHIFKDSSELLRGASLARELMRMQLLLGGKFTLNGNGQSFDEDYKMKADHLALAKGKSWAEDGSDPAYDIQAAKDKIETEQGVTITRAIMNHATWTALLGNNQVKSTLLANNANTSAIALPQSVLSGYLSDEFGIKVQVYEKGYVDIKDKFHAFIPDGKVVFLPETSLGRTVFAPTPEEFDLIASPAADVAITDTAVAVTTTLEADPVTKSTKVSQNVIPTFEQIDSVYVLDAFSPKA